MNRVARKRRFEHLLQRLHFGIEIPILRHIRGDGNADDPLCPGIAQWRLDVVFRIKKQLREFAVGKFPRNQPLGPNLVAGHKLHQGGAVQRYAFYTRAQPTFRSELCNVLPMAAVVDQ